MIDLVSTLLDAASLAAEGYDYTVKVPREPGPDYFAGVDWVRVVRAVMSSAAIIGGLVFVLAGALGVLRLPDFYTRLHAAGMTDTLGAELILIGLIIQAGFSQVSLKLLLIGFLLLLTSPTATHAVAHAAWEAGLDPLLGRWKAKSAEDAMREDVA